MPMHTCDRFGFENQEICLEKAVDWPKKQEIFKYLIFKGFCLNNLYELTLRLSGGPRFDPGLWWRNFSGFV